MSVHAPGRGNSWRIVRLRTGFARALAGALPSSAPLGGGRRKLVVGLSMTSMIDVLVVMTVFLLLTFQSSGECGCRRDLSRLPTSGNVQEIVDAPIVDVAVDGIRLDGVAAASHEELAGARRRVARLETLFNLLRAKHEIAKQLDPNKVLPSHVILAIDGEVPASVVKSVVMTAARSGYPSVDFMVHAGPKG